MRGIGRRGIVVKSDLSFYKDILQFRRYSNTAAAYTRVEVRFNGYIGR